MKQSTRLARSLTTASLVLAIVLCLIRGQVNADVFMHNPRGSNNRNCETDQILRNSNRLFDSQNNAAGGYACPRAWPFACYKLETESARASCNQQNSAQPNDDIFGLNLADNDGVLDAQGTRTQKMYYYEGSVLPIQWTQGHGCGEGSGTHCDIIIQYACEDTLSDDCGEPGSGNVCGPRDGVPITNDITERGNALYQNLLDLSFTNVNRRERDNVASSTIPVSTANNAQSDPRFGRHEPLQYYIKCSLRERNKGLWTADQTVREDARGTRQSPNGDRYGYECPEEKSYYPYWQPSPWKDIAILTDRVERCAWLTAESQNVKEKFECVCPTCASLSILVPNNAIGCGLVNGTWVTVPSHNISAPYCGPAPTTADNQLGSASTYSTLPSFNWTIPSNLPAGQACVLRIRYNITTGDLIPGTNLAASESATSALNGINSPLQDRQKNEFWVYKGFEEIQDFPSARLGLAINTNQYGRLFQDRSHVFEIRKAPTTGECYGKRIHNLNVRGKRGNIVQVFPAVEYNFVPGELSISENDCVHVQWTGSDYNPARNANDAYGGPPYPTNLNNGGADRSNMVQIQKLDDNLFVTSLDGNFTMFNTSRARKINLAFIGQPYQDPNECMTIEAIANLSNQARNTFPTPPTFLDQNQNFLDDNNDRDRYWKNCGKLSHALTPYFDGGLFLPGPVGTYTYMNTRSNSFGNRALKGVLKVLSAATSTPSASPTLTTNAPSVAVTGSPTTPESPTVATMAPTLVATDNPTVSATNAPTLNPTTSTGTPTVSATNPPTLNPTTSTGIPTVSATNPPTLNPTTKAPTKKPTKKPTTRSG